MKIIGECVDVRNDLIDRFLFRAIGRKCFDGFFKCYFPIFCNQIVLGKKDQIKCEYRFQNIRTDSSKSFCFCFTVKFILTENV